MKTLILAIALLISGLTSAQGNFEKGMSQALQLWGEGKNNDASALFERIAAAEKSSWLPNYYIALINTTEAFRSKDAKEVERLLLKSQTSLDKELLKDPNNPELLVLQAMIHTARINMDPMTYGSKLSGKVMQLYNQAEAISPENPRVVLSKAQFELGSARFFGTDVAPICARIERSIGLFENFPPESQFHPNWGISQAKEALKNCKS